VASVDRQRNGSEHAATVRVRVHCRLARRPVTVAPETLATEALHVLEQRKITSIVVVDAANVVQGVVHLHDLWRTQMI